MKTELSKESLQQTNCRFIAILVASLFIASAPATWGRSGFYTDVPHYDQSWFNGNGDCLPNSATQVLGWHDAHRWPRMIPGGCNRYSLNPTGVTHTMDLVKETMNWWSNRGTVPWEGIQGILGDQVARAALMLDPLAFWWTEDEMFPDWNHIMYQIDNRSPMMICIEPSWMSLTTVKAYYGNFQNGNPNDFVTVNKFDEGHSMCLVGYYDNENKVNATAHWALVDTGWSNTNVAWINLDDWFPSPPYPLPGFLIRFYTIQFQAQGPLGNYGMWLDPSPAPTGLVASQGAYPGGVQIQWNKVAGATSYEVIGRASNDSSDYTYFSYVGTNTSCTHMTAVQNDPFYYWVRAHACDSVSDWVGPVAGYAPCHTTFYPSGPDYFEPAGGEGWFNVDASGTCPWTLKTTANWIHLSKTSGQGLERVDYTVDRSFFSADRVATITATNDAWADTTFEIRQYGNDNLAHASQLGGSHLVTAVVNNQNSTRELGEPSIGAGHSVWYTWWADTNGYVRFSTEGSSFDTVLAVYTAHYPPGYSNLVLYASNNDARAGTTTSELTLAVTNGTTYFICVDSRSGTGGGGIHLSVQYVPANDMYVRAFPFTGRVTGSNTNASQESWENAAAYGNSGKTVWWKWTADVTGPVSLTTIGSDFDTILSVFQSSPSTYLNLVASNDNDPELAPDGKTSLATFNAIAGTNYFISVDGKNGASGNIVLQFNAFNDNFADRIPLTGATAIGGGRNSTATTEAGEPSFGSRAAGYTVWWSWTAPASGRARFDTAGSSFDSILRVYTGNAVNNMTFLGGNDDYLTRNLLGLWRTNRQARLYLDVSAGTTYQIGVDGTWSRWFGPMGYLYSTNTGTITLTVALSANNDVLAQSLPLTNAVVNVTNVNVNAGKEDDEPDHAGNAGGASIWYAWTAPDTGSARVWTEGSKIDTLLAVYTGTAMSNLVLVASNDDRTLLDTASKVIFDVQSNLTYYVAVDGKDGAEGVVALHLAMPGNDDFDARAILVGSNTSATNSTIGATRETGEPVHADTGGKSAWWTWRSPVSGVVKISTAGSTFNTLLAVYTGTAVTNLVPVAANDNDPTGPRSFTSRVLFQATAGSTYHIAVDGYHGASGHVVLDLEMPGNDDFADRLALSGTAFTITSQNMGATRELGEPIGAAHSVWWTWTPPASGWAWIDTRGSEFPTTLGVYRGSSFSAMSTGVVATAADTSDLRLRGCRVGFPVLQGASYQICMDGYQGRAGQLVMNGKLTSMNDNFTNRIVLTGLPMVNGNNRNATREGGEPAHAGSGSRSVWWAWTAPASGYVTITTAGSAFDTLLGVYTGASVSTLTTVATNDDDVVNGLAISRVVFAAVGGTQYQIAVDGKGGGEGDIILRIAMPANDDFSAGMPLFTAQTNISGGNYNATLQASEPAHAGKPGGKSVWWHWTAPKSGPVCVTTKGSPFDTVLGVYTGLDVGNLTTVAANDDDPSGGMHSRVIFNAVSGTPYRIAVDGLNGTTGDIQLGIHCLRMSAPALSVNGFECSAAGPVGSAWVLLASSNLTTWTPVATNVIPVGAANVVLRDPLPAGTQRQRFYRTQFVP